MFYSSDADATRDFLRDVLELPFTDIGRGWLIFDLPEADLGAHPADAAQGSTPGAHDVSFYCDDIKGTVAELKKRGAQFKHDPMDHGYGWVTYLEIPGGIEVQLYEPKYQKRARKPAKKKSAPRRAAKVTKAKKKGKPAAAKSSKGKSPKKKKVPARKKR